MLIELPESIRRMSPPSTIEMATKLATSGSVLDLHADGKSIRAKVISGKGKMAAPELTPRRDSLTARCTCGVGLGGAICEHALAVFISWRDAYPEQYSKFFPVANNVVCEASPEAPKLVPQQLRRLIDLVAHLGHVQGTLSLKAAAMPCGESRWNHIVLEAEIMYKGRSYSGSNIRRLLDLGSGAGGMALQEFPPQDQALMIFLSTNANRDANAWQLDAHMLADFLHLLVGFPRFFVQERPVRVNPEIASLALEAKTVDDGHTQVQPRLKVAGRGLLETSGMAVIAGRNGYWLGGNGEYWWLPGLAAKAWILAFLKGETLLLGAQAFGTLNQACVERLLPVEMTEEERSMTVVRIEPKPTLLLHWDDGKILGRLLFNYGGALVSKGHNSIWNGHALAGRDSGAEDVAEARMRLCGFDQPEIAEGEWSILGLEKMAAFLSDELPRFDKEWDVRSSDSFRSCAREARILKAAARTRKEDGSWIELDLTFKTDEDEVCSWHDVLLAVQQKRAFVQTKGGRLARVDDHLRQLVERLPEIHVKANGQMRFPRHMALLMQRLFERQLRDDSGQWLLLRQLISQTPEAPHHVEPALMEQLRHYQRDGVSWLQLMRQAGLGCILADEMGLGKTVQALAFLQACVLEARAKGEKEPCALVVCPTSLVDNWAVEAARFCPELKTLMVKGSERNDLITAAKDHHLVITSYALLRRDIEGYNETAFNILVIDEAQNIKNSRSQNALSCKALDANFKLALTGTPLENSAMDIWSLFDFLLPGLLGSRKGFAAIHGQKVVPEEARTELAARIRPFVMRRIKSNILTQLPPKQEQIIRFELADSQKALYTALMRQAGQSFQKGRADFKAKRFEILALLLRLRQVCCHPQLLPQAKNNPAFDGTSAKFDLLKEIVREAVPSSHRLLLFSQFTTMLDIAEAWLKEEGIPYLRLDGGTPQGERQALVDLYNNDATYKVFLLSLKAGGTGLNLTGADTVLHYDLWWNPMAEDQATDRAHRIGQTRSVTSIKLVARDTIEERILELQTRKRGLFMDLLEDAPDRLGDVTEEDIEFLLS